MNNLKLDEKELEKIFNDIKKNKKQGIEKLYSKYKNLIYKIAFTISKDKEDSEDITQIIFAKIYEMEISKLPIKCYASWIYSITKNETINFIRKKKNYISTEEIYEIPDNNEGLNKTIDNIEFNKLISKLNKKEQEIISLKILSDFSFEEISKLLKEPVGTIKWRYYKSIYSLKTILGNLAMSIVSFGIGIKVLISSRKGENISKQEDTEQDIQVQEDTTNSTISDEDISQNKSNSHNSDPLQEEIFLDTDTVTNEIQESTIYEEPSNNNYNQYVGYSFLSISIIFLVISLYFFIKYQLKHLKKVSK